VVAQVVAVEVVHDYQGQEYQTKDTKEVQVILLPNGGLVAVAVALVVLERPHRQMGLHKMVMVD
jgi:hypothetical protein